MKKSIFTLAILTVSMFGFSQDMDSTIRSHQVSTLKLSGPRMGVAIFTGSDARTMQAPKGEGGFNTYPAFFQMGYQFEKQYLTAGNLQGLFEFIPMVSGMDQNKFIPSFTVMNGLRNNKTGFEFAFGPSFNISQEIQKFQDTDGKWYSELDKPNIDDLDTEFKLDSRGFARVKTYMVFAFGTSFKSGALNIPVNAYFVPSRGNPRFGISAGFNAWQ